jgi:hypothetical protein
MCFSGEVRVVGLLSRDTAGIFDALANKSGPSNRRPELLNRGQLFNRRAWSRARLS